MSDSTSSSSPETGQMNVIPAALLPSKSRSSPASRSSTPTPGEVSTPKSERMNALPTSASPETCASISTPREVDASIGVRKDTLRTPDRPAPPAVKQNDSDETEAVKSQHEEDGDLTPKSNHGKGLTNQEVSCSPSKATSTSTSDNKQSAGGKTDDNKAPALPHSMGRVIHSPVSRKRPRENDPTPRTALAPLSTAQNQLLPTPKLSGSASTGNGSPVESSGAADQSAPPSGRKRPRAAASASESSEQNSPKKPKTTKRAKKGPSLSLSKSSGRSEELEPEVIEVTSGCKGLPSALDKPRKPKQTVNARMRSAYASHMKAKPRAKIPQFKFGTPSKKPEPEDAPPAQHSVPPQDADRPAQLDPRYAHLFSKNIGGAKRTIPYKKVEAKQWQDPTDEDIMHHVYPKSARCMKNSNDGSLVFFDSLMEDQATGRIEYPDIEYESDDDNHWHFLVVKMSVEDRKVLREYNAKKRVEQLKEHTKELARKAKKGVTSGVKRGRVTKLALKLRKQGT